MFCCTGFLMHIKIYFIDKRVYSLQNRLCRLRQYFFFLFEPFCVFWTFCFVEPGSHFTQRTFAHVICSGLYHVR